MEQRGENGRENDIPSDAIRAENEQDRSPEYKSARDEIVVSIRSLLNDVERRQSAEESLGKHGKIKNDKGIIRTILHNPFPEGIGTNLMSERTQPIGTYFYHDTETGQRNLVVVSPDKVIEVVDSPIEQLVAGPEAGYSGVSPSVLASFTERLPDGSYTGAQVESSGKFTLKKFDGAKHSSGVLSHNPDQVTLVSNLWVDVRTHLLGEG